MHHQSRPDVYVNGQVMDPEGCAIRACFDPGEFVDRRTDVDNNWEEPLHRWQARAVIAALAAAGHAVTIAPGARPTPPRWHD
jgi:hypothetical protein